MSEVCLSSGPRRDAAEHETRPCGGRYVRFVVKTRQAQDRDGRIARRTRRYGDPAACAGAWGG